MKLVLSVHYNGSQLGRQENLIRIAGIMAEIRSWRFIACNGVLPPYVCSLSTRNSNISVTVLVLRGSEIAQSIEQLDY
jgi:hypothetical protein